MSTPNANQLRLLLVNLQRLGSSVSVNSGVWGTDGPMDWCVIALRRSFHLSEGKQMQHLLLPSIFSVSRASPPVAGESSRALIEFCLAGLAWRIRVMTIISTSTHYHIPPPPWWRLAGMLKEKKKKKGGEAKRRPPTEEAKTFFRKIIQSDSRWRHAGVFWFKTSELMQRRPFGEKWLRYFKKIIPSVIWIQWIIQQGEWV